MTIRWRLFIFAIQLIILGVTTYVVTGKAYSSETWFIAGLLAVVINPQLLEPYYPRPVDVLGDSIVFLLIFLNTNKTITSEGWNILAVIVGFFFILGIITIFAGAGKSEGHLVGLARAARSIAQLASARLIYSSAFFLSILEFDHSFSSKFWILTLAWVGIMGIGRINWQSVFLTAIGQSTAANAEGMIGPSSILVTAPEIPAQGTRVSISSAKVKSDGVVISRIIRPDDVWEKFMLMIANFANVSCKDRRSLLSHQHVMMRITWILLELLMPVLRIACFGSLQQRHLR